jgi:BON domain
MKALLVAATLLLSAFMLAQQQGQPPYAPAPRETPPIVPDDRSPRQLPPDMRAPAHQQLSNTEIEQQLKEKMGTDPALQQSDVLATVDDKSVVLTGTVDSEQQRELALRMAQSYAGDREVIDKMELRSKT